MLASRYFFVRATLLFVSLLLLQAHASAQSQYQVLYAFTGGADGGGLWGSVVLDQAGNLYGTAAGGGAYSDGTVFELSPQSSGEWTLTILHNFPSTPDDGETPNA